MLFPKHENVSAACRFTFLRPYVPAPVCLRPYAGFRTYLGEGAFCVEPEHILLHRGVQPGPFFKMAPLAEIRHHPKTKIVYDFMSRHNCTLKFTEREENEQSFPSL